MKVVSVCVLVVLTASPLATHADRANVPRDGAPPGGHVHGVGAGAQHLHVNRPVDRPVLIVDGAATPEAIPDDVAFRHFVRAAAIADRASARDLARREGLLARAGLSAADRLAFAGALRGLRQTLDTTSREVQQLSPESLFEVSSRIRLADLRGREVAAIDAARSRLETSLSPEGLSRLDVHVREDIKRRIKIYDSIPQ
jgi:hypothetical protein